MPSFAGISPFLTEQEVFDSASRCARLANAFWQFAHDAQDLYAYVFCPVSISLIPLTYNYNRRDVIRRCMVEDVLAPNSDQRGLYSKYLNVFKKQIINVTARMAQTIDTFGVCRLG